MAADDVVSNKISQNFESAVYESFFPVFREMVRNGLNTRQNWSKKIITFWPYSNKKKLIFSSCNFSQGKAFVGKIYCNFI